MNIQFKHKKSLGQNFLINKKILKRIISLKDFKNQEVVEVGPGKGYLTEFIIKKKPGPIISSGILKVLLSR